MLYRYMFGDRSITVDAYRNFRSQSHFKTNDKMVDQDRESVALNNLKYLLKVRQDTRDVRSGVQRIMRDVLDGKRTVNDVRDELALHRKELMAHLPTRQTTIFSLEGASLDWLIAAGEKLLKLLDLSSQLSYVAAAKKAWDLWHGISERRQYSGLRGKYPLVFYLRDLEMAQAAQQRRMIPQKWRR